METSNQGNRQETLLIHLSPKKEVPFQIFYTEVIFNLSLNVFFEQCFFHRINLYACTKECSIFIPRELGLEASNYQFEIILMVAQKSLLSHRDAIIHRLRLGIPDSKCCYCFYCYCSIVVELCISYIAFPFGNASGSRISVFFSKVISFILTTISGGCCRNKNICIILTANLKVIFLIDFYYLERI